MTKAFDLNEKREKGKTTKVAESKLVLGAEFLFLFFWDTKDKPEEYV